VVATVGSIAIDLSANTAKFTQGFKSAATTVDRESGRMSKAVAGIGAGFKSASGLLSSFAGGLAGGAAFAALTSFTGLVGRAREAIGRLDDIADRAKTSGIGTDLLQSLERGAEQAGLEVNDLASGLAFFAKGMGQAAEGTGRLYSGLEKLNPQLLRMLLNTDDQEKRLRLVAEALDRTDNAAQRAALSAALLGDVDLSRLFEGGAAGFDKLAKSIDGNFTPEQIKKSGEYDAALKEIERSINNTVDSLVISLGPALVGTSELFREGVEAIASYIEMVNELGSVTREFAKDPSIATFLDALLGRSDEHNLMREFAKGLGVPDSAPRQPEPDAPGVGSTTAPRRSGMFRKQLPSADGGGVPFRVDELRDIGSSVDDASDNISDAVDSSGSELGRVLYDSSSDAADTISGSVSDSGYYIAGRFDDGIRAQTNALDSIIRKAVRDVGDFSYSGNQLGGGSTSWAGSRITARADSGLVKGASSRLISDYARLVGTGMPGAPAAITESGGGAAINVSVVVKPVLEGQRLSPQSTAEIKQAASAGANAALRAFNGR